MQNDRDYIKQLESLTDENECELIEFFSDSKLPNDWFLQHFINPESQPFHEKQYWDLFAKVLVKRGVKSFKSSISTILIWIQDVNWPGCGTIVEYIRDNLDSLKTDIIKCLKYALSIEDHIWVIGLIALFIRPDDFERETITYRIIELSEQYTISDELQKINILDELVGLYDKYPFFR